MKYLHTIINNNITNTFIDFINNNFNPEDHRFYVIRGWSQQITKVQKSKNVLIISNLGNINNGFKLIFDIIFSKKILIHGLFTPYLISLLFFQPWVLKKCNWLIWGGDLDPYNEDHHSIFSDFVEYMRSKLIPKLGVITSIKGDYAMAKQLYKIKAPLFQTFYPFNIKTEFIDKVIKNDLDSKPNVRSSVNIVVGNSSSDSNNHFEIFDLLEKFKNENIKIFVLLAYGDKLYADKVIEKGNTLFGEKFICMREYLPFEEYIKFINNMDIIVFNHERQQGCGNLFLAMYLKKKIYINHRSSLWGLFTDDIGLNVNRTVDIKNVCYSDFVEVNNLILEENSRKINNLLQEETLIKQWKELF